MSLSLITDFLNNQQWQFTQDENIFIFGISGENGKFQCILDYAEADKRFVFISVCGAYAPQDCIMSMLELLNEINSRLFFGTFDMNMDKGEIKFKTNLALNHILLSAGLVAEMIMTNVMTMDTYLPAIIGLIFEDISVYEALQRLEKENE